MKVKVEGKDAVTGRIVYCVKDMNSKKSLQVRRIHVAWAFAVPSFQRTINTRTGCLKVTHCSFVCLFGVVFFFFFFWFCFGGWGLGGGVGVGEGECFFVVVFVFFFFFFFWGGGEVGDAVICSSINGLKLLRCFMRNLY